MKSVASTSPASRRAFVLFFSFLFIAAVFGVSRLQAAPQGAPGPRWVASWAVAPIDFRQLQPPVAQAAAMPGGSVLSGQTLRQQLQTTLTGERVRVRFSNRFGKAPMHIAAASVARSTGADAVSPGTLQLLRFGGGGSVTIAPGAEAWSDAADLPVEAGQALAVSTFVDRATPVATVHMQHPQSSWLANGNAVAMPRLLGAAPLPWNHIVTGLDVWMEQPARTVVAFGDSITAGSSGSAGGDDSYPDLLATRLRESGPGADKADTVAVLNAGIGGNRLLADGSGPSGLSRFAQDALGQSGVTHVIVLLGTNDIGRSAMAGVLGAPPLPSREAPTAARITAGLEQLVRQARAKGVKVLLGTVPPFRNTPYWTEETEAMRGEVNRWIRSRQDVDGVVDFDTALRSPADPLALNAQYDSGDHLHPNSAGYAAMTAAIDLRELQE